MIVGKLRNKIFILFLLFSFLTYGEERAKIGLVLSGGGGKGFVHIGVLRVLEREKIPIDYITGSSIGSIIGFLYAMGYSVDDLEQIIKEIDWDTIFFEKLDRVDIPMEEKLFSERYIFSLPMENFKIRLPKGLISGQKIYGILKKYAWEARGIRNFDNFPIPFRAIATDLATGEPVVIDSGDIVKALNASMAIPSLFRPVEYNGKMLTDALASKNFPVEEVKQMGADIVIGVDIGAPLADVKDLSFLGILNQIQAFRGYDFTINERKKVDFLIEPEISTYSPTDFSKQEELIKVGEESAMKILPSLKFLSNSKEFEKRESLIKFSDLESYALINEVKASGLGNIEEEFIFAFLPDFFPFALSQEELDNIIKNMYSIGFFERIYYEINGDVLEFQFKTKQEDYLNVGFNYSNNYGIVRNNLIIGASLNSFGMVGSKTILDGSLSQYPKFEVTNFLYHGFGNSRKIGLISNLAYDRDTIFNYNIDTNSYQEIKYNDISLGLFLGSVIGRKNLSGIGVNYDNIYYDKLTYEKHNSDFAKEKESVLSMYFKSNYDSYNSNAFPTNGMYSNLELRVSLDFLNKTENDFEFYKADFYSSKYFTLNKKLSMNLGIAYERVEGHKVPKKYMPKIGVFNKKKEKIDFYGIDPRGLEVEDYLILSGSLQFNIIGKAYLKLVLNTAYYNNKKESHDVLTGYGLNLAYDSFLGPIELIVSNDVFNESEMIYKFNLGYKF